MKYGALWKCHRLFGPQFRKFNVVIGRTLTGFSPTPNRACDFHRTRNLPVYCGVIHFRSYRPLFFTYDIPKETRKRDFLHIIRGL